jgi:mannose-6-phosphate isomerase-like protein (cupin superfamily)
MLAIDIAALARQNEDFRRAVATAQHSQVVLMTIPLGEEIGEEVHDGIDQLFGVVEGEAGAVLEDDSSGGAVLVPGGTRHTFRNTADSALRLWTVYAPPEHPAGTVHGTKADAEAAEHH